MQCIETFHGCLYTAVQCQRFVLFYEGFYFAERMAVDASTGHLYFTALSTLSNSSYIGVIHRTLRVHRTLIPNLQTPRAIALYPSKGCVHPFLNMYTSLGTLNRGFKNNFRSRFYFQDSFYLFIQLDFTHFQSQCISECCSGQRLDHFLE